MDSMWPTGSPSLALRRAFWIAALSEKGSTLVRMANWRGVMWELSAVMPSGTCATGMYMMGGGLLLRPPLRALPTMLMIWRAGSANSGPTLLLMVMRALMAPPLGQYWRAMFSLMR